MRAAGALAAAAASRKSRSGRRRVKRGGVKYCARLSCECRSPKSLACRRGCSGVLPIGFPLREKSIDAFALILAVEQIDEPLPLQAQSRAARRSLAREMHQTLGIGDRARAQ